MTDTTSLVDEPLSAEELEARRKPLPPAPLLRSRAARPRRTRNLLLAISAGLALVCVLPWSLAGLNALALWFAALPVMAVVGLVRAQMACRRDKRLAAERARNPDRPWIGDSEWDPTGTCVSPCERWRRSRGVERAVVLAATSATLAVAWRGSAVDASWVAWIDAGLVVTWLAWRWRRVQGAGTARVAWAKFPFAPGERVALSFGTSEGGASFERVEFRLRHVAEVGRGGLDRAPPAVLGLPSIDLRDHRAPGLLPGPGQDVEVVFDLPERAQGTCLSAPQPSYRVLDVVGTTSAGPFSESFLVPIYERPRIPEGAGAP